LVGGAAHLEGQIESIGSDDEEDEKKTGAINSQRGPCDAPPSDLRKLVGHNTKLLSYVNDAYEPKGERLRCSVVWPAVCGLKQSTQMINLTGMVEVVSDHDADDVTSGESLSPIREAVFIQLGVVAQGADGREPALMSLGQPSEKLLVRT
jgi:hypothetical protein